MVAAWPYSLPQGLLDGTFEQTFEDNVLESPMETGPSKMRRRSTANVQHLTGQLPPLTLAQFTVFTDFWRRELRSGVLPFYLATTLFRFTAHAPPKIGTLRTAQGMMYAVTLSLDILP